jgi:hypothetical protein
MVRRITARPHGDIETLVLIEVLFLDYEEVLVLWPQQAQFAGTDNGFGAFFYLQFFEAFQIMPFHGAQGEEQPLAYCTCRSTRTAPTSSSPK